MQTYLKSKPAGIQLFLFIGLAFGIFSIFGYAGAKLLPLITGIDFNTFQDVNKWSPNDPRIMLYIRGMLLLQFLGLFLIPVLLFGYFSDPKPTQYLGLRPPHHFVYFIAGTAALLVAIPLVEYVGMLNKKMVTGSDATQWMKTLEENASKQIQFMLGKKSLSEYLLNLFFIAVFAAVGEELFFRGVLQKLFIKLTRNPWTGIIITAILFSGFHLQFYGFLPRLLLGIVLGVLYWYSGSLWTAIVAHFFYDAFLITLIYANPHLIQDQDSTLIAPAQITLMAFISLALTLLLVYFMVKKSKTNYSSEYRNDDPPDALSF
ncbi:MAG: CPBP family intramembrane metalloprotease [Flavisolibacter sp.]|nr:CPBP family intramembrane metalloprotease [Flavisolibacter sp.]